MERPRESPVRAIPDLLPRNYKPGMWAWLLHRITGLGISLFLLLHIWEITSVSRGGGTAFDLRMAGLRNPLAAAGEFILFLAVVYHGINGVRVLLFDVGIGVRRQKPLFWGVLGISALIIVLGASTFMRLIFGAGPTAVFGLLWP
ncbi:MAG: succinate dehydrogenase, cytochrome b556 subunit [Symbiobacteriia bacterium]